MADGVAEMRAVAVVADPESPEVPLGYVLTDDQVFLSLVVVDRHETEADAAARVVESVEIRQEIERARDGR